MLLAAGREVVSKTSAYNITKLSHRVEVRVERERERERETKPMIFIVLQYILIFDKMIFQINVNIYNLFNSFINTEYCSSGIPPRRRSSFNTGNNVFFIISLPFIVNSVHKATNIVRNPFNDVGKNGIP